MGGAATGVGGAVETEGAEWTDVSVTLPKDEPFRNGDSLPRFISLDLTGSSKINSNYSQTLILVFVW